MQSVALQIKPLAHHVSLTYGCRSALAPACASPHVLNARRYLLFGTVNKISWFA